MQQGTLTTAQEDMNQILAGLPVQVPGQPGPDLENGPSIPPITQDEINQIFANIAKQPPITQDEVNKIFDSVPVRTLTNEEINQIFDSIPQQSYASEEEWNRLLQQSNISGPANPLPQESQMVDNFQQYQN